MNNNLTHYVLTDDSCAQYVKKISETRFRLIEYRYVNDSFCVCNVELDLKDYTLEDIWEHCSSFYNSLEQMIDDYGRDVFKIMAECVFEDLDCSEMDALNKFNSEEECENAILKFVLEDDKRVD